MKTSNCLLVSVLIALPAVSLAQWVQQPFVSNEYLNKVRFVNTQTGWILGNWHVFKTTDGGTQWFAQDTVFGGGSAFYALNSETAFWGEYYSNHNRSMRRTSDGGLTWHSVDTLQVTYFDIDFVDNQTGFAVGGKPFGSPNPCVIKKTVNGGISWETVLETDGGFEFESVSFVDHLQGWVLSYRGLVYRTTDGGISWTFQDSVGVVNGTSHPMLSLQFTSASHGLAVGGTAGITVIARTTDGGITWQKSEEVGGSLAEVRMVNSELGWVIGQLSGPRTPLRTTDGGASWYPQTVVPPISGFEMTSIHMIDQNIGWIVCSGGKVYKTTNGGVVSVNDEGLHLPQRAKLDQNYPNPFNPTTTIRYQLPTQSLVTLKLLDVLGREIATLVDRIEEPGDKSFLFDASNLASGVYFYKLQAGSFVQVRRMVLVK